MEIFGAFVFLGLIMAFIENRERRAQFPTQICGYCPMAIFFDFKARCWFHQNGEQYAGTLPELPWYRGHPALPHGINPPELV